MNPVYFSLISLLVSLSRQVEKCSRIIKFSQNSAHNGSFSSPGYPSYYPASQSCVTTLVARKYQKVKVTFDMFKVAGSPPNCQHDYLDIFISMKHEHEDLLDAKLLGRYCGNDETFSQKKTTASTRKIPRVLVSMHHIIVIAFYSDSMIANRGFHAIYEFIDADPYLIGNPTRNVDCGRSVSSVLQPDLSKGIYADNLFCSYLIMGNRETKQRIRLRFTDIDIFSGGEHCPFDFLKVYDGSSNRASLIATLCGAFEEHVIFSTGHVLYMEFMTRSGRFTPTLAPYVPYWDRDPQSYIERRGFSAEYETSSSFIDLDFIESGVSQYILGSECDQRILSGGQTNGTLTSPRFPLRPLQNKMAAIASVQPGQHVEHPQNVTCFYYLDGLSSLEHLEKCRLHFESFYLGEHGSQESSSLSIYLKGQSYDEPAYRFTASNPPLDPIISINPRMLLVFHTSSHHIVNASPSPPWGFSAKYQFVTDYAIPGTPTNEAACDFIYNVESSRSGDFNSPRYPGIYPSNSRCIYQFIMNDDFNRVRITFENFQIDGISGNCSNDYLEMYSIMRDESEVLMARFCDKMLPGPMMSLRNAVTLKIFFVTDASITRTGFKANYEFMDNGMKIVSRCTTNLTESLSSMKQGGGLIESPNFPLRYQTDTACKWTIRTKHHDARILLEFPTFSIEGGTSGCPEAVLRISQSTNMVNAVEYCGSSPTIRDLLTTSDFIILEFYSSAKAVGAKGFRISWTEIRMLPEDECNGFYCSINGYCIDLNLRCNGIPNCGFNDNSDETKHCDVSYGNNERFLHFVLIIVTGVVMFILLIFCAMHQRRRTRRQQLSKQSIEVRYVTRAGSRSDINTSLPQSTSRLLLHNDTSRSSVVW